MHDPRMEDAGTGGEWRVASGQGPGARGQGPGGTQGPMNWSLLGGTQVPKRYPVRYLVPYLVPGMYQGPMNSLVLGMYQVHIRPVPVPGTRGSDIIILIFTYPRSKHPRAIH
jgi:hypothetical protein